MNTANLQLEGLCIAFAALNNLLIRKGVVARGEIAEMLDAAAEIVALDRRELSPSNVEAIRFPIRLLSLANNSSDGEPLRFSELARTIGELKDVSPSDTEFR